MCSCYRRKQTEHIHAVQTAGVGGLGEVAAAMPSVRCWWTAQPGHGDSPCPQTREHRLTGGSICALGAESSASTCTGHVTHDRKVFLWVLVCVLCFYTHGTRVELRGQLLVLVCRHLSPCHFHSSLLFLCVLVCGCACTAHMCRAEDSHGAGSLFHFTVLRVTLGPAGHVASVFTH